MLEKYLNFNSFSELYTVEDWNELLKQTFFKYFPDEHTFLRNKDLLRTELINYFSFSQKPEYLGLFENTFNIFNRLKIDSITSFENIFLEHFEKVSETDEKWTTYSLTQTEISKLSERDIIYVKLKAIEDILEGCYKERFKLLFHTECYFLNINYNNNLDFGKYISNFQDQNNFFKLYIEDPIFKIKTSQWRNIAAHKIFKIKNDTIKIKYGRTNVHEIEISHTDFENIFQWIKSIYETLRLSQVITFISNPNLILKINENDLEKNLRFESWLVHIIHNLQIVGFPFVKIHEEPNTLCIQLKKKFNTDLKESVIHASQILDQLSVAVFSDEFCRKKFKITKVAILSDGLEELASAHVIVSDLINEEIKKELIDCVKFKIGDILF